MNNPNPSPRFPWILLLLASSIAVAAAGEDDWPEWVDSEDAVRERIAAVNEGELAFLADAPATPVHHHRNRIRVSESSLTDGWVLLEQCHRHLDKVGAAEIVFRPDRARAIEVTRVRNIGSAVAEGSSVQLRDVGDASEICLRVESRALHEVAPGLYELQNGPFMRRFLDGYYPMRVTLQIDYPERLRLTDVSPVIQPGFSIRQAPGRVNAEALFEGRLQTRFRFLGN